MLPAPIWTVTELLTTPGTAVHVGLERLSLLSNVKPVSDAGHESVRLVPLLVIVIVGPPGGGGEVLPLGMS